MYGAVPSSTPSIERAVPAFRNVLVTANEMMDVTRQRHPVNPMVRQRVFADAAAIARGVNPRTAVARSSRLPVSVAIAGLLVLSGARVMTRDQATVAGRFMGEPSASRRTSGGPLRVTVTVNPPAYTVLATDDLGLQSLAIRYTKVSGSGEQFEFRAGELPLTVWRNRPTEWRGRTSRSIRDLDLREGDMLV